MAEAGRRDGEARSLQQQALHDGAAAPDASLKHRVIPRPESVIHAALAQKILLGWIQNRHQTLYPLVMNLGQVDAGGRQLIGQAMAFALQSAEDDPRGPARAEAWLRSVGGSDDDAAEMHRALSQPVRPDRLIAAIRQAGLGALTYAAIVASLNRRATANRRFHDYAAARLGLADDVARSINRRY